MDSALCGPTARRRNHTTEHETMSLIKKRIRALGGEVSIVLRQQQRLQVRRIVDRVRPRIRSEELEVMRERSEEHTSELQSQFHLVCRLLLEKKKKNIKYKETERKQ